MYIIIIICIDSDVYYRRRDETKKNCCIFYGCGLYYVRNKTYNFYTHFYEFCKHLIMADWCEETSEQFAKNDI